MPIKALPIKERPREKAFKEGVEILSDTELLAIIIASGNKNNDAVEISRKIIKKVQSLSFIENTSITELSKIPGIGKIKALQLKVVIELSNRIKDETNLDQIFNKKTAITLAQNLIGSSNQEKFLIVCFDVNMNLLQYKILYKGTENNVSINPKEILAYILKIDAKKFYCFHNHPSGIVKNSEQDILLTKRIKNYCDLFDIELLGHYIVNRKKDYSIVKA